MIDILLLVAVVGAGAFIAYTHQPQLRGIIRAITAKISPCASPLTYSIGTIDPQFGISKSILVGDLREADAIWETAHKQSSTHLFEYRESGGDVTVNLIYDTRQISTDKLKSVGIQTDQSKASYNGLKTQYDTLAQQVKSKQSSYTGQVTAYQRDTAAYNAEVTQWNDRGGAPREEQARLQNQKTLLAQAFEQMKSLERDMNADISTLNTLATSINQLIVELNLHVAQYNRIGADAGEFEEGEYRLSAGVETIDVYEYSNHMQLVRVLAHEMGHALGMEHVSDAEAIMYKINSGKNLKATRADSLELKRVCPSSM